MIIRGYLPSDGKHLRGMLDKEGIVEEEQVYDKMATWVLEDRGDILGFFSFNFNQDPPLLRHFCTKRCKRRMFNARMILRGIKALMKDVGKKKMEIMVDKKYLMDLIEYYFRTPSHRKSENRFYHYLVEVS